MITERFSLGDVMSFQTYAPAVLGNQYQNVVALEIIGSDTTRFYNFDAYAVHANVFPLLPVGSTPDDPRKYRYLVVQNGNGDKLVVGLPWIIENSVTVQTLQQAVIIVPNVRTEDLPILRQAITAQGKAIASITLENMTTNA